MAAALGAEWCEICSDVDGVYTADPRVVPQARRIPILSYEETQELAESGAKVLNAQAVEFAKERGIAIYARSTTGPLPGKDPSEDGTVVRKFGPRLPGSVVGIASEKEMVMIQSREVDRLLNVTDEFGVSGKQLHVTTVGTEQDGISMVVSKENLHQTSNLRSGPGGYPGALGRFARGSQYHRHGNNRVAPAQFLKDRTHCANLDVHCSGIATSSFRITWLIEREKVDKVVQDFHRIFIENANPAVP